MDGLKQNNETACMACKCCIIHTTRKPRGRPRLNLTKEEVDERYEKRLEKQRERYKQLKVSKDQLKNVEHAV